MKKQQKTTAARAVEILKDKDLKATNGGRACDSCGRAFSLQNDIVIGS